MENSFIGEGEGGGGSDQNTHLKQLMSIHILRHQYDVPVLIRPKESIPQNHKYCINSHSICAAAFLVCAICGQILSQSQQVLDMVAMTAFEISSCSVFPSNESVLYLRHPEIDFSCVLNVANNCGYMFAYVKATYR